MHKLDIGLPFVSDHLPTSETTNRNDHIPLFPCNMYNTVLKINPLFSKPNQHSSSNFSSCRLQLTNQTTNKEREKRGGSCDTSVVENLKHFLCLITTVRDNDPFFPNSTRPPPQANASHLLAWLWLNHIET